MARPRPVPAFRCREASTLQKRSKMRQVLLSDAFPGVGHFDFLMLVSFDLQTLTLTLPPSGVCLRHCRSGCAISEDSCRGRLWRSSASFRRTG